LFIDVVAKAATYKATSTTPASKAGGRYKVKNKFKGNFDGKFNDKFNGNGAGGTPALRNRLQRR
jgi:hypothetical protein